MGDELEGLDSYLRRRFDVKKLLGRGAYGIVWQVVERESGRIMALKRCFDAFQNSTDAQRTFREIMFLQELNGHENIVRLMNVLKAESHQDLYVLFDYMETDLQNVISAGFLKPIHIEYVTYQTLKALKYIHSGGVLHRDLKPSNILMNSNCHVRMCDFGLARTVATDSKADSPVPYTDYVATRWYRAPELLLAASVYSDGVDMWSMGCIIGEMISGKPILKGRSTMDQLEKILELTGRPSEQDLKPIVATSQYARSMIESLGNIKQIPATGVLFLLKAPLEAKSLALSMLKFNPDKRPSAEEALKDPFVEKFHLQEPEPLCDKVIRMPIADTTKMKAADYRSQIYLLIAQRRKMLREDLQIEKSSAIGARPSSKERASSKNSPSIENRRSSSKESAASDQLRGFGPQTPWSHESGAAAPPTTPS